MFFDSWTDILRTVVVGFLAYVTLVAMLRVTGKRTLAKMDAFDLIVTVALGSTLATVLLSADTALAEGIVAFAVLAGLQYAVAWASVRSERFSRVVKSQPRLLYYRGHFVDEALRAERVTRSEVTAAIREQGTGTWEEVAAVILETSGEFAVVTGAANEELLVGRLGASNKPGRGR